jgi:hypothetical protein
MSWLEKMRVASTGIDTPSDRTNSMLGADAPWSTVGETSIPHALRTRGATCIVRAQSPEPISA